MNNSLNNLYLSIGSFFGSVGSFFLWFVTNYYIMAILGFVALIVSIWAGVLTIREKRLSIRYMKGRQNRGW
jgi:hypothetical protein